MKQPQNPDLALPQKERGSQAGGSPWAGPRPQGCGRVQPAPPSRLLGVLLLGGQGSDWPHFEKNWHFSVDSRQIAEFPNKKFRVPLGKGRVMGNPEMPSVHNRSQEGVFREGRERFIGCC